MGNSSSSGRGHHEETVDFGYLTPQGIYTGSRDWNQTIVAQLICERRLAPFYRPLEDYDESWDDEQILASRKEPQDVEGGQTESSSTRAESISSSTSKAGHHRRPNNNKDVPRYPEAAVYRGAIECPICFLYYPPNINHSRCCDQAICTECFVQIKRADPTTTHLVSEPASCPYCVQENFGVVYTPPPWRTGLGSEGATPPSWPESPKQAEMCNPAATMQRRRKSLGHDSPEVVTIDHIRPDWETKLAAVRAAVTRRANRRIIMRQVGDRLIPVGVTSGRVHPLPTEDGQIETGDAGGDRGSRRSRRRQQNPDINQLLGTMGLGGQDLEELMVMEAMRLSLIEHDEQQRREMEEEAKKKQASDGSTEPQSEGAGSSAAEVQVGTTPESTSTSPTLALGLSPAPSLPDQSPPVVAPVSAEDVSSAEDSSLPRGGDVTDSTHEPLSADSHDAEASTIPDAPASSQGELSPRPFSLEAALESVISTASAAASPSAHSSTTELASISSPPLGALSAAMRSAASTAGAIASPGDEAAQNQTSVSSPPSRPRTPTALSAVETAEDRTGPRLVIEEDDTTEGAGEEGKASDEADTSRWPPMNRADSLASSLAPSGDPYDTLSSSPDSSFSHKPLLDSLRSSSSVVTVDTDPSSTSTPTL
ncbi:hypothetical protein B0H21DRAFT_783026 [Amylocystis lapponica]|nr:hypothetical protein B0H21DRAFT_783026 [Amylocystis lapponica]